MHSAAAMCIAVGKVSLDDWPRLTWSLGWIGSLEPSLASSHLDRAVGDDLVGVHIGLGSAAGLPDHEREMIVEPAIDDFLSHPSNQIAGFLTEDSEFGVALCGGLFQHSERTDELARHALVADLEIGQRTGRLRPPISVGGNLDLAQAVLFDSSCHRPTSDHAS